MLKQIKIKKILISLFFLGILILPVITLGADIQQTLGNFKTALYGAAVIIIVIMVIWTAILFAISAGDPEKMTLARRSLYYIVFAAVILAVAMGFYEMIQSMLQ